jgi:hypothetical protein
VQEASRAEAKEAAEAKAAQLEKIKQLEPLIKAVACVPWLAAQKVCACGRQGPAQLSTGAMLSHALFRGRGGAVLA